MPKEGTTRRTFDPQYIRDLSEAVYRLQLNSPSGGGPNSVERMLADDGDGGVLLRKRARTYDQLTRVYLRVLGHPPD